MSVKAFIDTNVLVYLFDARDPTKRARAAQLLQELSESGASLVVSTQILQEAYVALTRKLGMSGADALAYLQMLEGASVRVHTIDTPLVWRAAERSAADRLSFWDALIVEAALEADCERLYSEDLQTGRVFDTLGVVNPFV
ncbi:MAG: PIN domain-containing protein [Dehalococcoidia bacterium]